MLRRVPLGPDLDPSPGAARIVVRRGVRVEEQVARAVPSLKAVLLGEERWLIDGRIYRLGAGQMMLVPSGSPARIRVDDPATQAISFDWPASGPLPGKTLLLPLVSHRIGDWLAGISAMLHSRPDDVGDEAAAALRELHARVGALAEHAIRTIARVPAEKGNTRSDLWCRVEMARAHLHANVTRRVPLWEMAEQARMSPYHCARAFRAVFGVAPAAYHRMLRLDLAAERLRAGEVPAELYSVLGFSSQASFARAFKQYHGVPPGSLRGELIQKAGYSN